MSTGVTIVADSFMIRGPKQTDGSYTVSFTTGEYMQDKIADLIRSMPPLTATEVTIKVYEG